jgi:glutamate synthase domain-containing protein 2
MCFKGTASRIGGVGFEQIARDALALHEAAYKVGAVGGRGMFAARQTQMGACSGLCVRAV